MHIRRALHELHRPWAAVSGLPFLAELSRRHSCPLPPDGPSAVSSMHRPIWQVVLGGRWVSAMWKCGGSVRAQLCDL